MGADAAAGHSDSTSGPGSGDDYQIISCSSKPFPSLPLFLPRNCRYDPKTNTVTSPSSSTNNRNGGGGSSEYDEHLVLVPHAGLEMLQKLNKPVGCVSCVGPYRTGKSLLLSRFLKDSKSFRLGPTLEGCTRGIWISTSAIVQPSASSATSSNCATAPTHTFLLDCEGTGDPLEGSETSNARIALTCILISSVFLYNNTGRPDRSSLQFLSYLTTIRHRIPLQLSSGGLQQSTARRNFPAFLWVFRDFFLQLPTRKDTGKPYTLREYMLERVLVKQNRGRQDEGEDTVIDSLLNDFRSLDVLSIGYPKHGDVPFTPEELSTLDSVPWSEFDEEFRTGVEETITFCLSKTEPFRLGGDGENDLGPVAHGPLFASWCERVVELANSEDVIPDIPDMQHRLMQQVADDKVNEAIDAYAKQMEDYLDGFPVYNDDVAGKRDGMVIAADMVSDGLIKGEGVAEEKELERHSLSILVELCKDLTNEITSKKILDESMDKLKHRCIKDEHGSILAQLRETNERRSRLTCEALARKLYMSFRHIVRDDATNMSDKQFEAGAKTVEAKFKAIARGPAVQETADTFLKEQRDADRVFLERVGSINALYKDTLQKKEKLDKDVQEKTLIVSTLKRSIEEINHQHQEQVERINNETQEKMQKMAVSHTNELNIAIEKQKKIEEENISKLRDDMNCKLKAAEEARAAELKKKQEEMEAAKKDAEQRLADEVAAREERLQKEEEAHEQEIQKLMRTADETMKKEIMAAEEKRRADQAKFQREMETKLSEAENRMNEEVKAREARLKEEEERHKQELERVRKQLNEKMEVQKKKYLQEIDTLEKQCFNFKACCIQ